MRAWLQRDDIRHSVKLTATFAVVLVAQIVIGVISVFLLSLVSDVPGDALPSISLWICALAIAASAAATHAVHRVLSE